MCNHKLLAECNTWLVSDLGNDPHLTLLVIALQDKLERVFLGNVPGEVDFTDADCPELQEMDCDLYEGDFDRWDFRRMQ